MLDGSSRLLIGIGFLLALLGSALAAALAASPADIAADMGISPAAVRKAKSRVLHRLRQEVGDLID